MSKKLRVALIGCGLIGERRLSVIQKTGLGEIAGVFDTNSERATALAQKFHVPAWNSAIELIEDSSNSVVIVSTANSALAEYGIQALKSGKQVILEKPGALNSEQVRALVEARESHPDRPLCKIGYEHRFHAVAERIKSELEKGEAGRVGWVRAAYGHGGRPGYEREWRFQKGLSGGGEIIDQGVHFLDLLRWWLDEELELKFGSRFNAHYRSTEEDNGFLYLTSKGGTQVQLHCSTTQWKNLFRVELGAKNVLLVWEGLGNQNYGEEKLTLHYRKPEGGAPRTEVLNYGMTAKDSWEKEWKHFYGCVTEDKHQLRSPIEESISHFKILDQIHQSEVEYIGE